jgi:hypothetical protein
MGRCGMLIDNQLTGNERELGRFFVVLEKKGRLEWQKPGTRGSGSGRNDKKKRRSWKKDRNENRAKAIMIGLRCWLMLMKMGICLRSQLRARFSK